MPGKENTMYAALTRKLRESAKDVRRGICSPAVVAVLLEAANVLDKLDEDRKEDSTAG